MLQIFYDSQDFFLLKELEKLGPKKGIISQFVKDVIKSLVDDDLVFKDKIGTSTRPDIAGKREQGSGPGGIALCWEHVVRDEWAGRGGEASDISSDHQPLSDHQNGVVRSNLSASPATALPLILDPATPTIIMISTTSKLPSSSQIKGWPSTRRISKPRNLNPIESFKTKSKRQPRQGLLIAQCSFCLVQVGTASPTALLSLKPSNDIDAVSNIFRIGLPSTPHTISDPGFNS
ncbi:hypothetical protein TB2_023372 [Malus domestica]